MNTKLKIIILFLFCFYCNLSFGQDSYSSKVYKLKTFQTAVINLNERNSEIEWERNSILVVINFNDSKVKIYAKKQSDIDLLTLDKNYLDENDNTWIVYSGIDENGSRCKVELEVFKNTSDNDHVASLFLIYKDYEIVYRLQRD